MPPLDYAPINHFPRGTGAQTVQVTSVLEQTLWSKSARHRLQELSALPQNWNGYGSPVVNKDAIEHSFTLLSELGKLGMPEPNIVPVSGGGLQLEWRRSGAEIEIEIFPDRSIHFLVVDAAGEMFEGRVSNNGNVAAFTSITCWFLSENKSISDLSIYDGTY